MTPAEQRDTALRAQLGPLHTAGPCAAIRPSIGIFPEQDKAIVQFGDNDCGKIAAANFLKAQIEPKVRQYIREEVFEVNAEDCAPFATESMSAIFTTHPAWELGLF